MGRIVINIEEHQKWIECEGNSYMEDYKQCPSYKAYLHNMDMIGEEEDFKPARTIDIEHRRFHGELKRTAVVEGMRQMLQHITYIMEQMHDPEEERRTEEMLKP